MLCLFVNFYEYILYVFEVGGVPIVVMELWFYVIMWEVWVMLFLNHQSTDTTLPWIFDLVKVEYHKAL